MKEPEKIVNFNYLFCIFFKLALDISGNKFSTLEDLSKMKYLKKLNLSYNNLNQITSFLPPGLEYLALNNNMLGIIEEHIAQ